MRPWPLLLALACCKARAPAPTPSSSLAAERPAFDGGAPCGALSCTQFESPALAFAAAIPDDARVVAVGEAHAQKDAAVASSAKRFTESVLPSLAGRASDLLLELMLPPSGCAPAVAVAREAQAVVTTQQAPTDQGEYVAMGEAARRLGIVPDLLRPTCRDVGAVAGGAADDAIDQLLETIARLTTSQAERLVDRNARDASGRGAFVVTYGGAIHNDRDPPPEKRAWCFGPALDAYTGGRYVAIDLYVPQFIEPTELWTKQPWYPHYDAARLGAKTTLFRVGERSYVIILPR